MANGPDRVRRLSYAGPSSPIRESTRRISYAGPNLASVPHSHELSSNVHPQELPGTFNFTHMIHNFETLSSNRLDSKNRNRRASRTTDEGLTWSQQSILSDIDRFVRAVSNMDSTVLVPSRLQDIDLSSKDGKLPSNSALGNTDLLSFFTLVKDVKNELLWGTSPNSSLAQVSNGHMVQKHSKHTRQPSDDSLGSTGSDQELDSDLESVTTDRDTNEYSSNHLALSFRHHLQALQAIMHQLTESADFLSSKYQESIDSIKPQ